MIHGCACDAGFGGYDCGERLCISGDDPLTAGAAEVQLLECDCGEPWCGNGTVALTYRGQTTAPIPADATAELVKYALETLSTVADVDVARARRRAPGRTDGKRVWGGTADVGVALDGPRPAQAFYGGGAGGSLCSDAGTTAEITFVGHFGDLLALNATAAVSGAAPPGSRVRLQTVVDGECSSLHPSACSAAGGTESAECSNRGNPPAKGKDARGALPSTPRREGAPGSGSGLRDPDEGGGAESERAAPPTAVWPARRARARARRRRSSAAVPPSGVCDRSTGACGCFSGFASSDGRGGAGPRPDCGHLVSNATAPYDSDYGRWADAAGEVAGPCPRVSPLWDPSLPPTTCSGVGVCDADKFCNCTAGAAPRGNGFERRPPPAPGPRRRAQGTRAPRASTWPARRAARGGTRPDGGEGKGREILPWTRSERKCGTDKEVSGLARSREEDRPS